MVGGQNIDREGDLTRREPPLAFAPGVSFCNHLIGCRSSELPNYPVHRCKQLKPERGFEPGYKLCHAIKSPAHIGVEFGRRDLRVFSLFGYLTIPYPAGWIISFNRPELDPWWGAWSPALLAIAAALVIVGLMVCWTVLATFYFIPVWLVGLFADRDLTLPGSWRLAGAALMPGAFWLSTAIVLYALGVLSFITFMVSAALHFVVAWIFAVLAILASPRHPESTPGGNPFGGSR